MVTVGVAAFETAVDVGLDLLIIDTDAIGGEGDMAGVMTITANDGLMDEAHPPAVAIAREGLELKSQTENNA